MMPGREDYARLRELFDRAADLPIEERRAFVAAECDGDPGLRRRLEAMLDQDAVAGGLLDRAAVNLTGGMLAGLSVPACGPYRLESVIGEGGMGVVYRARRDDLGSSAAVKVLRDAWVSPARRERFEREQRTLARLHHPGIATLLDAGVTAEGTPWIAMELVEGAPLVEYCRQRNLDANARLQMLLQVCDAVQYAHERAVIHRDLKPSNILVDAKGSPRLIDFGIAKQLEDTQSPVEATRAEFRMLTPKYAAPEQLRGEAAGVYTDVHALGVLLREVLDNAPGKADWNELKLIAAKAAHDDPVQRYRGADALASDIRRYLAGSPIEARPDSPSYRAKKFLQRNRTRVAAAAVALAVAGGMAGYFTWRLQQSRDEAVASAERAQRIQAFLLNLFEGGDKAAGPAHGLTVETLIDRGVREAGALDREPAVQAEVFDTLGRMYGRLGRYDAAGKLLLAAAPRHPASLVELASLRSEEGKFEEAESLARGVLSKSPANLDAQETLGRILTERGQYAAAIAILEPAMLARDRSGSDAERAASTSALAGAHFYAGHYDESKTLNEKALALRRKAHGEGHPMVAEDLTNLGAIAVDTGRYADGEKLFREVLRMREAWYGAEHPETGAALTMLGRALVYQKKNVEGKAVLERALAIQEKVYGPSHSRVASALNDLGNIAVAAKDFEYAEARFRRMEDIYRAARGDAHYLVATAMSNRANVYLQRGESAAAEKLMREVVVRYTNALSARHVNTAIARVRLGRSLLRQKKWREAVAESQAGYDLLRTQAKPSVSWLRAAEEDLVAARAAIK